MTICYICHFVRRIISTDHVGARDKSKPNTLNSVSDTPYVLHQCKRENETNQQ